MRAPRRWRRRWTLAVGMGLIAVGVARLASRPRLSPPPPGAPRVAASPKVPVGLSVCWIESGRVGFATSSALLIRHPSGNILIDAGDSMTPRADFAHASLGARAFIYSIPGFFKPTVPMSELLERLGVSPGALRAIVISHAHLDHLGGAMDVPAVPIWTPQEEVDFAAKMRDRGTTHIAPRYADALASRGVPLHFVAKPYELFSEQADLFGDGSVVVVRLPGHTPGSVGTFVNLSPDRRLFHVGDSVNELAQVHENLGKRRLMSITDVDGAGANATVGQIQRVWREVPGVEIIPAHDRHAWENVFGEQPRCIDSASRLDARTLAPARQASGLGD